jgi:DNA-3-methyladenine glycosylase
MKLAKEFYQNEDVVDVAKQLLGKVLYTNVDGVKTAGIITETEAYCQTERGSHAYGGKRTPRTEIMFAEGGYAYVYLCYGMYYLFNVVTGTKGHAQAVLIRGIEPYYGLETILIRRRAEKPHKNLFNGPGKVCAALGIDRSHYGVNLRGKIIWLEDKNIVVKKDHIVTSKRIGIDYAGDDAHRLWRFELKQ